MNACVPKKLILGIQAIDTIPHDHKKRHCGITDALHALHHSSTYTSITRNPGTPERRCMTGPRPKRIEVDLLVWRAAFLGVQARNPRCVKCGKIESVRE